MTFIDTHTHIYDEAFAGEEDEVIKRARQAGVTVMLQPDVDSRERDAMFALVDMHPDELHAMLGLYPGSVDKGWRDEIDAMLRYRGRKVVALGEIGLDYHYGAEFAAEQREAFRIQMELAAEMDLPVNIHLREATEDFFRVLEDLRGVDFRGVMHAYSGSYEVYRRLLGYADFKFGIGGVVTYKNAGIAAALEKMSLDDIVLETDCPWLTPVPYRGKRNEPAYVRLVAEKVAQIKGLPLEEVAAVTTRSAQRLFNL